MRYILSSGRARFPRLESANSRNGGKSLLFGKIFAENCMQMKEIEPRGRPLDPPMLSPGNLWQKVGLFRERTVNSLSVSHHLSY